MDPELRDLIERLERAQAAGGGQHADSGGTANADDLFALLYGELRDWRNTGGPRV